MNSLICLSFDRISCFLAKAFGNQTRQYDFVYLFELKAVNERMSLKKYFLEESFFL